MYRVIFDDQTTHNKMSIAFSNINLIKYSIPTKSIYHTSKSFPLQFKLFTDHIIIWLQVLALAF